MKNIYLIALIVFHQSSSCFAQRENKEVLLGEICEVVRLDKKDPNWEVEDITGETSSLKGFKFYYVSSTTKGSPKRWGSAYVARDTSTGEVTPLIGNKIIESVIAKNKSILTENEPNNYYDLCRIIIIQHIGYSGSLYDEEFKKNHFNDKVAVPTVLAANRERLKLPFITDNQDVWEIKFFCLDVEYHAKEINLKISKDFKITQLEIHNL